MYPQIPVDTLAPVCLFVYNRPSHTRQTLDCLSKAKLADSSILYIFCDGPKESADIEGIEKIKQVQELALLENRFKEVNVVVSEINIGLGRSVINGVSNVLGKHDTVIVLEDDILVHADFLVFTNYYLQMYKNNCEVMHISGFQRNSWLQFFLPRVFFTRFMDCWGWATWADRWKLLVTDISVFDKYLTLKKNKKRFDFSTLEHSAQFDMNRDGLKTWAIFWYATIAMFNGLCLKPRFSYTKNIGNDGSGANNIINANELASNFTVEFKKCHAKPNESRIGEWYIRDAYSKKSRKRFNRVKGLIFVLLTKIRKSIWSPAEW